MPSVPVRCTHSRLSGRFFVPVFFVMVGASVNLRLLNPVAADSRDLLMTTGFLLVIAVLGKLVAGYAPFWFPCRKAGIGWSLVPRGAVRLVFAQFALSHGVVDQRLFCAITLMVILTTMIAPPVMRWLLPAVAEVPSAERSGATDLISEP